MMKFFQSKSSANSVDTVLDELSLELTSVKRFQQIQDAFLEAEANLVDRSVWKSPGFIPIISTDFGVQTNGVWIKCVGGELAFTFVGYNPEYADSYFEIARTERQFLYWILAQHLEYLKLGDPSLKLTTAVEVIAEKFAITDLQVVRDAVLKENLFSASLAALPAFQSKQPLELSWPQANYDGLMPSSNSDCESRSVSTYELYPRFFKKNDLKKFNENFFDGQNRIDQFQFYLENKEFDSAWATLNSHGWNVRDAELCLGEFAEKQASDLANLISNWWCKLKKKRHWSY